MKSVILIKFYSPGPGIPDEAGLLKAVIQNMDLLKVFFGYASGNKQ
jgi:anthranilate/para-aminobenzoate synthase component II